MEPAISQFYEEGDLCGFTLSGINVSIANALRRIILSEIPTVVIRTETHDTNQCNITVNTGRLHNEIVKHRLSCIPIHIKELDLLPNKYILEVDMKNDTDTMMFVTTEHFKIKNKTSGNYLTKEETRSIFPPNQKTHSFIDFVRLRPKISDTIPGEQLKLTADFSVGSARENSMFNVVSKCSYGNTPNLEQINDEWSEIESKSDANPKELEFQKKNFYILDAQRRFIADSFDFVIQTIGVFDNQYLIKTGLRILSEKFAGLLQNIESSSGDSDESNTVFIIQSETLMENCFDIILEDEDYTVGKVLEYILYDKYYLGDKTLDFCGFKKFHPHDTRSTIRITFASNTDKSVAKQYLIVACDKAKHIFERMMKLF